MAAQKIIAWDFDGVLNNNIQDGRFVWAENFDVHTGQSRAVFVDMIFGKNLEAILTGSEDLLDRLADWAEKVGYRPGAEALMNYWFPRDMVPDIEMIAILEKWRLLGIRQVMATNNEWRRAGFIARDPVFGPLVERIFAAGPMGVCKPSPEFFSQITEQLEAGADAMILVDDNEENVAAAQNLGWKAFHLKKETRGGLSGFLEAELGALL
ncbi:MAG: HAD-IA family hydrolase [Rhodobacteraceae bacterium]|nr:HAD-IA family hydrolase [Paracoccaceae bacterium]